MEVKREIDLKLGESFELRLPGLGTAGYVWDYFVEGQEDAVKVESSLKIPIELEKLGYKEIPNVGTSPDEVFSIQALKPRPITLSFRQHRPWESNKCPLREYLIKIKIKS